MTKHTPGPWSVSAVRTRESGEPVLQILGADGKPYALVFYSDKTVKDHAASYADAHLIAAAPDMDGALDRAWKALSWIINYDSEDGALAQAIRAIEVARKKARTFDYDAMRAEVESRRNATL